MISLRRNVLQLADAVDARQHQLAVKRRRRRTRLSLRRKTDSFQDIPEVEFVKIFRLGKETVRDLVEELNPLMPHTRSKHVEMIKWHIGKDQGDSGYLLRKSMMTQFLIS